jgi:hypothetical protein
VSTAPDRPEPDPTQFDDIVSRLRSQPSRSDGSQRTRASGRPGRGDFAFAVACLAVIVPMSMVVGGWLGLTVLFVSVVVASRLLSGSDRHARR